MLCRRTAPAGHRALNLLEKFCTCTNECAGRTGRRVHNISMLLEDKKYVRTISVLFEEILKASKHVDGVNAGYQLYIVILLCYAGREAHDDANFVIMRSLVFKFSPDEVAEAAKTLVSVFSNGQSLLTQEFSNSALISMLVPRWETVRCVLGPIRVLLLGKLFASRPAIFHCLDDAFIFGAFLALSYRR